MAEPEKGTIVGFFQQLEDFITTGISKFIAALFILISLGGLFGWFVAQKGGPFVWLLILPAIIGLFAFYNRGFAVFGFVLILLFVFL